MEQTELVMQIKKDAAAVIEEMAEKSNLKKGQLFIIGCSSSEIVGEHMGTASNKDAAEAMYSAISDFLREKGVDMAVQCCEHLNRAVVVEREVAERYGFEEVNVVPQPHAGGAFATKAYNSFKDPVVVENINSKADAGIDIGGVMIGMHIHPVVVPFRATYSKIGEAVVTCGRSRPKFIGGERAEYNNRLR